MIFRSDPILRVAGDGEFKLESPLVYVTRQGETIVVPPGFITDLASIPRIFHPLIPVNGRHRSAAIVHDFLYVIQDRERGEADRIFLEAMEDSGVRWTQRRLMYSAVRVGGWTAWGRGRRAMEKDRDEYLDFNGLTK
jgi:hypothetical protein